MSKTNENAVICITAAGITALMVWDSKEERYWYRNRKRKINAAYNKEMKRIYHPEPVPEHELKYPDTPLPERTKSHTTLGWTGLAWSIAGLIMFLKN